MSGVPKRSHEDPHEDSGSYPKSTHPHIHAASPYEVDSRKGPRSECRDGERRSPLQLVYRSPSNEPHLSHEQRDGSREIRSDVSGESKREVVQGPKSERDEFSGKGNSRSDGREIYGEAKRETQGPKIDDFTGKGNNNTGSYARENQKDGHAHLAWKDKDYHRGKRVAEGSTANVEPWGASRGNNPQCPAEVGVKDFAAPVEGRETVGENKVDAKSEDRFKDKDKKRKELKHREWGDRDKDRNDRRGIVLGGSVVSEPQEIGREEKEAERMEQKDREGNKDKDHIKREPRTGAEKEILQNEKELGEASAKPAEQEYVAPEQKKQNEPDGWEKDERESKEKRRERDGDSEAERAEKRSRIGEKESEDGCLEGEGATEREKDAFSYGVQQRKRMLRPRGSPQATNRDRSRSRSQDNEGYVSLFLLI